MYFLILFVLFTLYLGNALILNKNLKCFYLIHSLIFFETTFLVSSNFIFLYY